MMTQLLNMTAFICTCCPSVVISSDYGRHSKLWSNIPFHSNNVWCMTSDHTNSRVYWIHNFILVTSVAGHMKSKPASEWTWWTLNQYWVAYLCTLVRSISYRPHVALQAKSFQVLLKQWKEQFWMCAVDLFHCFEFGINHQVFKLVCYVSLRFVTRC